VGTPVQVVDLVIPELQCRGLFRTEYEGSTLRENLGLARPENRHSASHQERNAACLGCGANVSEVEHLWRLQLG
jgi:hypothetical protein